MKRFAACRRILFLSFCTLAAFGENPDITMSSKFNDNEGFLAIDADPSTCAVTGLEIGAWWKIDLIQPRVVTNVRVQGSASAFQIRVGNETTEFGDRGGFANNPLCVFSNGIMGDNVTSLRCKRPRYGQYLSFHLVDPAWPDALRLCEVYIE